MISRLPSSRPRSAPTRAHCARPTTPTRPRAGALARWVLAALVLVTSAACGNNGGSDGGTTGTTGTGGGGGGTPSSSGRLEVFQASLMAVDPSDPTTVIDLDPEAAEISGDEDFVAALPVVAGSWVGGAVVGARVEAVVYARKDRTLARISTDASGGTPTPERISADNLPPLVCDALIGPDIADFESTRFLFGAADEDCSERLSYRSVTLSDDTSTESRAFPGVPITPLVDPATGAHTGWLAVDQSALIRVDETLDVTAPSLLSEAERGEALGITRDGFVVLEVDQSVYTFDPSTNTLSDDLFTFETPCPCDLRFGTDGEFGFASDLDELFRIDLETGDVVSLDVATNPGTLPGFFFIPTFVLAGETRVAWSYLGDGDGNPQTFEDLAIVWRSVDKDTGDAFTVDTLDAFGVQSFGFLPFLPSLVGDRLFYNSVAIETALPVTALPSFEVRFDAPLGGGVVPPPPSDDPVESVRALAVQVDLAPGATPDVREDALWIGSSLPAALPVAGFGSASRVHRLTDLPDLADFENNTDPIGLESVDATNPSAPETPLGTLPDGALFAFALPGIGPERLGVAVTLGAGEEFLPDILYWVDDESDSLVQVTDTPAIAEIPAALF